MINTLSNAYDKISRVVKVLHYTRAYGTHAIHTLTTRDISPYGLDNVILSSKGREGRGGGDKGVRGEQRG